MTNVEKEIEKARRKPLAEEKLRELLLKLRKNATGTLTFGKLVNVIDAVGWEIEGLLGWVPMHYEATATKKALPIHIPRGRFATDAQFEGAMEDIVRASKDNLPDAPGRPGERVYMNVSSVKGGEDKHSKYFTHDEWRGAEGVAVGNSNGDVSPPILPSKYDVENRGSDISPNLLVHDVWRWMMKNGIEEAVSAALNMEVHVPASERTRENTGTCPACWGNYKLEGKSALVMHGYRRPGHGYIHGKCFGVGYQPAEISSNGMIDYRSLIQSELDDTQTSLDHAISGEINQISGGRRNQEVVKRGQPAFERLLNEFIDDTKRKIKALKDEVTVYDRLINAWRERPMPKEGEPQRGAGYFLK